METTFIAVSDGGAGRGLFERHQWIGFDRGWAVECQPDLVYRRKRGV